MYSKVYFLLLLSAVTKAEDGDTCYKDGVAGVCVSIKRCETAINDIKNGKHPQLCRFKKSTPIVCCVDVLLSTATEAQKPVATTTKKPQSTTTEYTPPVYEYVDVDPSGGCEPLPATVTSPKTGKKAWDMCVEYQEKLVYPCERGVALSGEMSRGRHCYHNADKLIVGGTKAAVNEFPHMAMLGYGAERRSLQWLCGGSLISDRFVLTAGHCTAGNVETGPVTHVLVGALKRSEAADDSKIYKTKRIINYPDYKPPYKYHDIALLETGKRIKLDQFTVPACLHVGDDVDDSRALTTGWGLTEYKGSASEYLQKVILSKYTTEECSKKFRKSTFMKQGFDTNTQMCYGDKTMSKDTCQGDSGGPMQIKSKKIDCMYVIVGVTSFGKACGFVNDPGLYTRVSPYVEWIENIVWP